MRYVIEGNCGACGGCAEVCPVDAVIVTPKEKGYADFGIDSARCIGCGECASVCPFDCVHEVE